MTISDERLTAEDRLRLFAHDPQTFTFDADDAEALVEVIDALRTTADTEQDGKGVKGALERIVAATPESTNSTTAAEAFSWTYAVAKTALSTLSNALQQEAEEEWRDLALQFDEHRIQTREVLRQLVMGDCDADYARKFLSKPPLSGRTIYNKVRQQILASPPPASPAPSQDGVDATDFQTLMRLKRDNVWDGSRPVLERCNEEMDRAFDLSDRGLIALEQVAQGVRLHITRKGVAALEAALKGGE